MQQRAKKCCAFLCPDTFMLLANLCVGAAASTQRSPYAPPTLHVPSPPPPPQPRQAANDKLEKTTQFLEDEKRRAEALLYRMSNLIACFPAGPDRPGPGSDKNALADASSGSPPRGGPAPVRQHSSIGASSATGGAASQQQNGASAALLSGMASGSGTEVEALAGAFLGLPVGGGSTAQGQLQARKQSFETLTSENKVLWAAPLGPGAVCPVGESMGRQTQTMGECKSVGCGSLINVGPRLGHDRV